MFTKKILSYSLIVLTILTAYPQHQLGKLFMIDISLQDAEKELKLDQTDTQSGYSIKETLKLIHDQSIVGIFFKNTPNKSYKGTSKTLVQLIELFKAESSYPLFFGIDAEWGLGMRLEDQKTYPKNRVIAQLHDKNYIYNQHKEIAQKARELGLNFLTSPVADIAPLNSYMKDRSYGAHPDVVSSCCAEVTKALSEEKVIGCAKHFPGHGRTTVDSHINLPVILNSYEEIEKHELVPFQRLIDGEIPCIMIGHLVIDAIDKENPATLSPAVAHVLRKKMNFKGVIISDALDMGAIQNLHNPVELNVKALQAGIDILLFPREVPSTIEYLRKSIEKNDVFKKKIEAKIERINHMLAKIGLYE